MANINDVAAKANVSKSTVSNVFNNKKKVSEEVRLRVLDVADELGYFPNKLASALTTKKTGLVGVFIDNSEQFREMDFRLIESITLELLKVKKHPVIYMKHQEGQRGTDEMIKKLGTEPIDEAIIIAPTVDDIRISKLVDLSVKPVIIGKVYSDMGKFNCVDVDNIRMTQEVTELLIKHGHAKIGFINSEANLTISFDRLKGYTEGLKTKNIQFDPSLVYYDDNSGDHGLLISERMLQNNDLTAIICASDFIAESVYKVAKGLKLSIPDELSVIALGGKDVKLTPKLSRVQVDYTHLGQEAVKLVNTDVDGVLRIIDGYKIVTKNSISEVHQ